VPVLRALAEKLQVAGLARRAPLGCFFAVSIAFTWALLPWAATSIAVSLVALCGPAVAATVVAWAQGRSAIGELRRRGTDGRHAIGWYLAALLLPLPITAARSGLEYLAGARGDFALQPISGLSLVVFFLVVGEELGWRGFALPHLLRRFGPWSASAALGAIWGAWHLPLFFIAGMPQFGTPFLPFVLYTVALSVVLTFLAQHTRGSVVIATAFHGAVNTLGVVDEAASPTLRGWTNAASYGLAALVIGMVAWSRPRRPD